MLRARRARAPSLVLTLIVWSGLGHGRGRLIPALGPTVKFLQEMFHLAELQALNTILVRTRKANVKCFLNDGG